MSAFKPIEKGPLRILSLLGGIPFKLSAYDDTKLVHMNSAKFKMMFVLVMDKLALFLFCIILQQSAKDFQELNNTGMTVMDTVSGFLVSILGYMAVVGLHIALSKARNPMENWLLKSKTLSFGMHYHQEDLCQTANVNAKKYIKILIALSIVGNIFYNTSIMGFTMNSNYRDDSNPVFWAYVITLPITFITGVFNQFLAAPIFIILYMTIYAEQCLKDWREKLLNFNDSKSKHIRILSQFKLEEASKKKPKFDILQHAERGLLIMDMIEDHNGCLQSVYLFLFTHCVITGSLCSFIFSIILFDFSNTLKILMNISFFVFGLLFGTCMFSACHTGQRLEDEMKNAKYDLQKYIMQNGNECNFKCDVLLERFSVNSVIRPKAYFGVNHSSFLNTMGTILTYLIVLLQFRVAEPM